AEAGRALAYQLSRGTPVDGLLDRAQARRCSSEFEFPGLGQARMVVFLRAVECRGHGLGLSIRALQRRGAARYPGALPGDDVLRTAHGVAHADPGRPWLLAGDAARSGGRRRTVEPRGDR